MGEQRIAVEELLLPPTVLRVANPIIRAVLRSPLHRMLSAEMLLLHITGRRSGRTYDVPVGRHEIDGALVVSAGGAWKHNLRGGAALEVTIDGHRRRAHGELVDDPDAVARAFATMIGATGLRRANRLGLRINVDRSPTLDELQVALADRGLVLLRLER
ncbi:nitroreductase/quinone reductase family protein [Agrococcus beijingensis]|uniref:nitroreductase/quinone reductase family protein n=1 Tax=Agrococcus beijingensis TaxID=3068634 RepID=UPI002741186A|nr:nitroreductase/quinone reductase family protein [Agrococcus sp. REN33]